MKRTWNRQGRHRTPVRERVKARQGAGRAGPAGARGSQRTARPHNAFSDYLRVFLHRVVAARRTKASSPPRLFLLTVFAYYHASLIHWINLL